ncbi:MAG: hypothetical protein ACPHY8_05320 [Patescibacteria group bacterium]
MREFLKTVGISWISFSVNVSNNHLSAAWNLSSTSSKSFSTLFPRENTSYFPFLITTVSLSSSVVNCVATWLTAFISLDKKTHS